MRRDSSLVLTNEGIRCIEQSLDLGMIHTYFSPEASMSCKSCGSANQKKFIGEMGIRSPGPKGLDKPVVWVFPELIVCLDCGAAEFVVAEAELRVLANGVEAETD
jgi:hypothetical protein